MEYYGKPVPCKLIIRKLSFKYEIAIVEIGGYLWNARVNSTVCT